MSLDLELRGINRATLHDTIEFLSCFFPELEGLESSSSMDIFASSIAELFTQIFPINGEFNGSSSLLIFSICFFCKCLIAECEAVFLHLREESSLSFRDDIEYLFGCEPSKSGGTRNVWNWLFLLCESCLRKYSREYIGLLKRSPHR